MPEILSGTHRLPRRGNYHLAERHARDVNQDDRYKKEVYDTEVAAQNYKGNLGKVL